MAGKLIRILFLAVVVLMPAGLSSGQAVNGIEPPEMPSMPDGTPEESTPAVGVPSIGDLVTVIDKATAGEAEGKDWSTPVKLVIIFSGLAIYLTRSENIMNLPAGFIRIGKGGLGAIAYAMILTLVIAAGAWVILNRLVLGRWLYAVGMNIKTAGVSGVPCAGVVWPWRHRMG